MALRQPTHAPLRHVPLSSAPQPTETEAIASNAQHQRLLDSQEWVVFSPSLVPSEQTATAVSEQTTQTGALSRLSDFGSLGGTFRSGEGTENDIASVAVESEAEDAVDEPEDEQDVDDLDSLDDGLHDFREPSVYRSSSHRLDDSGDTVLPTHDGLGMFPATGPAVQAQLWQFEQSNGRRTGAAARRPSSVQRRLDAVEEETEATARLREKTERIERWRMEQSMALLEEIEKETRRRRLSRASERRHSTTRTPFAAQGAEAGSELQGTALYNETDDTKGDSEEEEESSEESLWQRITRHFLRDLMKIDENILSVIFGEELPAEATTPKPPTADIQTELQRLLQGDDPTSRASPPWEERLLARIARELGLLVHQLSEHPGAFSTYLATQQTPLYAGLAGGPSGRQDEDQDYNPSSPESITTLEPAGSSIKDPQFTPTLQQPQLSYAARWGIDDDESVLDFRSSSNPAHDEDEDEGDLLQQEREYWERDLDIKMVFSFLRNRFSKSPRPPAPAAIPQVAPSRSFTSAAHRLGRPTFTSPSLPSNPLNPSTTTAPAAASPSRPLRSVPSLNPAVSASAARRAAMIRQQHPLVSLRTRQHASHTNRPGNTNPSSPSMLLHHHHHYHHHHPEPNVTAFRRPSRHLSLSHHQLKRRGSGSCASQSTKASRTAKSGSSRNYWDLGGSVGSGSLTTGGLGAWGEV